MGRESATGMVSLVRTMVLALVDDAGGAKVDGDFTDGTVVVNVTVAETDMGKVIGKQGRTARSLRTIIGAASKKYNVRCELNINGRSQGGDGV